MAEYSFPVTVPIHPVNTHSSKSREKTYSAASYHPSVTSQSSTVISIPNASQYQTSSAALASFTPASNHDAGDPCGPQGSQTDLESTLYTCGQINTTYTHAPSRYGVQCLNANPSFHQSINITSCATNIEDICDAMVTGGLTESQWNWSSGVRMHPDSSSSSPEQYISFAGFIWNERLTITGVLLLQGPNCTAGVWLNPLPAALAPNTFSRCRNDIYRLMELTCFPSPGGPFNVAAVNLQMLPGMDGTGSQVDTGYPSYIILPETYHDIYADGN